MERLIEYMIDGYNVFLKVATKFYNKKNDKKKAFADVVFLSLSLGVMVGALIAVAINTMLALATWVGDNAHIGFEPWWIRLLVIFCFMEMVVPMTETIISIIKSIPQIYLYNNWDKPKG